VDRRSSWLPIVLTCLGLFLLPRAAVSAPKDAAATKLADDAINNDYLALHFNEAAKKLKSAVAMCAGTACSPQVKARVNRDLGVVLIAGLNKTAEGKKAFAEAVRSDPSITLDKDLTTPAIEQAFKAARGAGGGQAAPAAPAAPAGIAPSGGGDIVHTPAGEQAILTPLPIYAELPSGVTASKVLVMYKPFGGTDWQKLELKKMGGGYGGEIPCQAVGSTTGDLSYYIQANDAEGDVVASSGTRKAPNRVPIQNELAGEAPHLPGRPAPAKCKDKADCPPGFPGCSSKKGGNKGWGASCEKDRECGEGLACKAGTCENGEKSDTGDSGSSGKSCDTSSDCESGEKCNADKVCEGASASFKKNWIGFHIQQDFSVVPAQQDVCGTPSNNPPANISCYDEDGFQYDGFPEASDPDLGTGNEIKGGVRRSTLRLLIDYSRLVSSNFSLGGRVGYVIGIGPDRPALAKFHLEARVAYWFGSDPFAKKSIRPFIAVFGGAAEVNDKFTTQIYETLCTNDVDCANKGLPGTNPTLTVWRRGAKTFAGGALGAMLPVGGNMGLVAEVKVQTFFPSSALTIAPVIGYAVGF
jgi:hypothetical protein